MFTDTYLLLLPRKVLLRGLNCPALLIKDKTLYLLDLEDSFIISADMDT